jgi:coenzyme F420-dependent glucose-6-phosphate dehydrogenase
MHDLLKLVTEAECSGFKTYLTSDHFHPWWHDNGYGNFTWTWLAAEAEQTTDNTKTYLGNICLSIV